MSARINTIPKRLKWLRERGYDVLAFIPTPNEDYIRIVTSRKWGAILMDGTLVETITLTIQPNGQFTEVREGQ
jgi:hypothetical protein